MNFIIFYMENYHELGELQGEKEAMVSKKRIMR